MCGDNAKPPLGEHDGQETSRRDDHLTPVWSQDPKVAAELAERLEGTTQSEAISECVAELAGKYGDAAYVEALHLLAHLHFSRDEAQMHWHRITELQRSMHDRLGQPVDVRVALVAYFVQVNKQLQNPTVVELKLFEKTRASAYRDDLTGLHNYRHFREQLEQEFQRYKRYSWPLSLIMMDIDDFKMYNDNNGHAAGNEALTTIAGLLLQCFREVDTVARYGGEEFAVLLPSTGKNGAVTAAERACRRILEYAFPHGATQPGGRLGVSMGVATLPADADEPDGLVRKADEAMYVAKSQGKGRVFLHGQDRRSYRRIQAELDGSCNITAPRAVPFDAVNVSEGGLLVRMEQRVPVGNLVEVQLKLPEAGTTVTCTGRIVRSEKEDDGRYMAAVVIESIPPADRRLLTGFLATI